MVEIPYHRIIEFFREVVPFNELPEEALNRLPHAVLIDYFPKDTVILEQDGPPCKYLYLIQTGAVGKTVRKDAVDLLGVTVSWEDFKDVKEMAFQLARMVNTNAYGQKASRSLLTMLKSVASSYQKAAKGASPSDVVYGRWMWQLAYSLSRVKEWVKSERLREQIMIIGGDTLDLGKSKDAARWRMIKYLHLPVRWAEYLTRKGE